MSLIFLPLLKVMSNVYMSLMFLTLLRVNMSLLLFTLINVMSKQLSKYVTPALTIAQSNGKYIRNVEAME